MQSEYPRIAIIIAAYNAEKYLKQCLDSLLKQTYLNWLAYIVNDGSSDDTENICNIYASNDSRFILLNKKNGGVVAARRYGIDHVKECELLTFLDSDDYYMTIDILEKAINTIKIEDADCICFNYAINGDKLFSKCKEKYVFKNEKDLLKNVYSRQCIDGNLQFSIYAYDKVLENFEILECANDDYINKLNLMISCKKVIFIPEVAYYYRVNPDSLTHRLPKNSDADYYYHAVEHTTKTKEIYPELKEEADYFCNWILLWLATAISKDKCSRKLNIYKPIMQALKKNAKVYIRNQYFTKKDRITFFLLRTHLFRVCYKLYHMRSLYLR